MAEKSLKSEFIADERAAMRERAKELKANATRAEADADVRAKFAEMTEPDRSIGEKLYEIVTSVAPHLDPKTYYGMPGWARDGKVVVFFQGSAKFKTRYATLGFSDSAPLDEGPMWPSSYAIVELTPAVEKTLGELIVKAAGHAR